MTKELKNEALLISSFAIGVEQQKSSLLLECKNDSHYRTQ